MQKFFLIAAPALLCALLCACSRDIQNSDAVRAGVIEYLTSNQSKIGLDPNLMQIDVTTVSFQKDQARATVAFRPKQGGDGAAPMMMGYALDRKGNKWVVRGRLENGMNPHGADPNAAPQGQLPPGHPPVGSKQ